MSADEQEQGADQGIGATQIAGRVLLVLLAVYLSVVELAQWTYLTYKGAKAPETYGEPLLNAIVGLIPLLIAAAVGWTSYRRGRGRWETWRATALTAIPACFIAAALSSGGWV